MNPDDDTYTDAKGRTRWRVNDEIGARLKQLGDFLVIGGYDESHAARYPKLAHTVSRHPESVEEMHRGGRLGELPGVGGTIAAIIGELLDTGTCAKWEEWAAHTPPTVVELTALPGLGAKTARTLYQSYGIDSTDALRAALDGERLDDVPGMGKKTRENLRRHLTNEKDAP
jgi:DNA polymerase (family 10)